MAKGNDIIPLIGSGKLTHFKDSLKAQDIVLSKEDIQKIESVIPPEQIAGKSFGKMQFRDGSVVMS